MGHYDDQYDHAASAEMKRRRVRQREVISEVNSSLLRIERALYGSNSDETIPFKTAYKEFHKAFVYWKYENNFLSDVENDEDDDESIT